MNAARFATLQIPERFGGSGLGLRAAAAMLEEVHAAGCNASARHAQRDT
jgi:acyl-CoA dehydrogenase